MGLLLINDCRCCKLARPRREDAERAAQYGVERACEWASAFEQSERFGTEGGEGCEAAAEADAREQHEVAVQGRCFGKDAREEQDREAAEHVDAKRDYRERCGTNLYLGAQIAEHRSDEASASNEQAVPEHSDVSLQQVT